MSSGTPELMAHPLKVLFYDDAPDFGGHELMTLAAVRHIVSQPNMEVGFMFFRGNARLSKQIADLAAQFSCFKPLPQDYASRRFQVFRTLVSGRAIRRMAATMSSFAPDVVVVAQGAIAFCSAGLMAAKRARLHTISYIPMTHPERLFSASRFRAALREPVNRIYYRLPDEYITISPRMEDYLRRKGLRQPVTTVQAAVDLNECRLENKEAARKKLGLAAGDWVVALIGRVQFWQKRQDLAVKALALARRQLPNLKLLVVGDGPDLAALKELVHAEGLLDAVVFAGWTDGLSPVYAAIDALVIPSRYEGVPLVLLQAMYFRRPVIASAVDGMLDILPPHWLFPSGDAAAFAARLVQTAHASEPALLDAHRERVAQTYSLPAFERAFMAAIGSAIDRLGRVRATP
jgi:glycosyltransferase involved in cell wall biosynthesis